MSDEPLARSTGEYFFHQKLRDVNPIAREVTVQEQLLGECQRLSGVRLPE